VSALGEDFDSNEPWRAGYETAAEARPRPGRKPTPTGRLTTREAEILTAIARGDSYEQAAADLGIGHRTAVNHMTKARRRTGAVSTVHLLALAITAGDVDPDCADGTAVTR
jgi:DNA-binding CsgD family transcriptional regulator